MQRITESALDVYKRQEYANMEEDGKLKQVDPDDVSVGDIIVIKAGERIPLDGKVVFGESMVDTSALTGEMCIRDRPLGSIEQHGPHLPVGTDFILSEAYIERLLKKEGRGDVNYLILPSLPYTCSICLLYTSRCV